jgi:hypothetical protein
MDEQCRSVARVVLERPKPLAPGHLLAPFHWAAQPLAVIIQSLPTLLKHVIRA